MKKLLSQIIAAAVTFWLATIFVPGVTIEIFSDSSFFGLPLTTQWQLILILGILLGLLNYFVKPVLQALSLPLQVVTLGLFTIVINLALLWAVDAIFLELTIPLWLPLLYTTFIVWALNVVLSLIFKDK